MPYFILKTNVSKDKIPANFLKDTSKLVAKCVGKPESYVVVQVVPDQMMSWGGTESPCGIAHLHNIGIGGVAENKKSSAALSRHLEETLGIPSDKYPYTFDHLRDRFANFVVYLLCRRGEIKSGLFGYNVPRSVLK